jgi:hypothetical protein
MTVKLTRPIGALPPRFLLLSTGRDGALSGPLRTAGALAPPTATAR